MKCTPELWERHCNGEWLNPEEMNAIHAHERKQQEDAKRPLF